MLSFTIRIPPLTRYSDTKGILLPRRCDGSYFAAYSGAVNDGYTIPCWSNFELPAVCGNCFSVPCFSVTCIFCFLLLFGIVRAICMKREGCGRGGLRNPPNLAVYSLHKVIIPDEAVSVSAIANQ